MTGMLLQKIEDAGVAVLTLTEGLEELEFSRSRLTRQEVCRQIDTLGQTVHDISPSLLLTLPEIDWQSWLVMSEKKTMDNQQLWWVIVELIPATLMWLRVYRRQQPELFATLPI